MAVTIDKFEYATDAAAQAAWVAGRKELYHYKCNDNAANKTVLDATGTNNGASTTNTSNLHTDGKIDGAFNFDGTAFINLGTSKFNVTSGAIAFWLVDKGTINTSRWIIGRGPNMDVWADMGVVIGSFSGTYYLAISGVGGTTPAKKIMLASAINNGDHFIFNLNADGTATVYRNNVLVTPTETLSGFDWDNDITNQLSIANCGARADGLFRFDGTLDDVRFYDTPLTEFSRNFIYNNGNGTEAALDSWITVNSEATIKTEGSYSVKITASQTTSLAGCLKRTVSPTINLADQTSIKLWVRASRTGTNFKLGFHDSGGTTTESDIAITSADTWEEKTIDISAVANANKDAIDSIVMTITNADAENTIYLDWMMGYAAGEILDAKYVYSSQTQVDGTVGTLNASTIADAKGSGSNLSAGILKKDEVVDDVTGTYEGTGGSGGGGLVGKSALIG